MTWKLVRLSAMSLVTGVLENYLMSRRGEQGIQSKVVSLYVRDSLDCAGIVVRDDSVENLWMKIKGWMTKQMLSIDHQH